MRRGSSWNSDFCRKLEVAGRGGRLGYEAEPTEGKKRTDGQDEKSLDVHAMRAERPIAPTSNPTNADFHGAGDFQLTYRHIWQVTCLVEITYVLFSSLAYSCLRRLLRSFTEYWDWN